MVMPEYGATFRFKVAKEARQTKALKQVAVKYGIALNTVKNRVRKLCKGGSMQSLKRSGRPAKLSAQQKATVRK